MKGIFYRSVEYSEKDGVTCAEIYQPGCRFSVAKTFDCGQCFRFDRVENSRHEAEYAGVAFGKYVSFAQDGDRYYIYGDVYGEKEDKLSFWLDYIGLDDEYDHINRDILSRSDNPALAAAVSCGDGIHILKQDRWETVCSFIISQNNNIPRIKKIIAALSERYGEPIGGGHYAFPTAKALNEAGESGLAALKTGFRAKYIADAAARVSDGRLDLDSLCGSTAECEKKLCEVKGIGPKVALCSLLFGFGHYDAFPVDVWIRRVTEKYFPVGFKPEDLGPYAGIAQQYLFYYERYLKGENA